MVPVYLSETRRVGTRLAHNTEIVSAPGTSGGLIRDFIRPAVRAIPFGIAERVGLRRVSLAPGDEESGVASRWTAAEGRLDISIATLGRRHHDIAMELLVCVGQALWEELHEAERRAWWLLLDVEIQSDFKGEIDEQALREKSALLRGRVSARSSRRLERYGQAAFAGTGLSTSILCGMTCMSAKAPITCRRRVLSADSG